MLGLVGSSPLGGPAFCHVGASPVGSGMGLPAAHSFTYGAPPLQVFAPGMRVEAEWTPGQWAPGTVMEAAADGRLTVRYDDGCVQRGVQSCRARMAAAPFHFAAKPPAPAPPRMPERKEPERPSSKDSRPDSRTTTTSSRGGGGTPLPPPPPPDSGSFARLRAAEAAAPAPPPPPPRAPSWAVGPETRAPPAQKPPDSAAEEAETSDEGSSEEDQLESWEEGSVAEACRRRLTEALTADAAALQAALSEAQRLGLHCREARRARDALLALENSDFRRRAGIVVDEAVEADDWWKLQAAMQLVVGGGGDAEQVRRLKEAMRNQKRRQEAVRELRKAGEARDAARLRTAIEAAMLVHVRQDDVRRAREALKALDVRPALFERLRRASGGGDVAALREAVEAARQGGLRERGPELLREEPGEAGALEAAEARLRAMALAEARARVAGEDVEQGAVAIEQAEACGVEAADVAALREELARQGRRLRAAQRLRQAVEDGTRAALEAALAEAAEDAGEDAAAAARAALRALAAREEAGAARARAEEELRAALREDDAARLAAAVAAAEAQGGAPALGAAKERLRALQARAGALQELRDAQACADIYRLRAAMAVARSAGVGEAELRRGQETLRAREGQAKVRTALDAAVAQRDADALQRLLEEAKRQQPLARQDMARAEAELHALRQGGLRQQLREAARAGDAQRLRALAAEAATAGVGGEDVAQAWDRLRELEARAWLRRQLAEAAARGDPPRLQAAIRQAELGGLAGDEVARLVAEGGRQRALQELHAARSGGNPYSVQVAIAACERAGCQREEVDAAMDVSRDAASDGTVLTLPTAFSQTQASVLTNPQMSSTTTLAQTHLGSTATLVHCASAAGADDAPQLGLLRNRVWNAPLRQPRPDEPPPSMLSVVAEPSSWRAARIHL